MIRPGHSGDLGPGPEVVVVDSDRHDGELLRLEHPICSTMSRLDDDDTVRMRRQLAGHPLLHAQEPVPAAEGDRRRQFSACSMSEVAVDGDGVVAGAEERPAVVHHAEQTPAERLVVVDDVERPPSGQQRAAPAS
jgi:hypothetical protein